MSGLIATFERTVNSDEAGQRLDRWLALPLPETGLRLRRRLIEDGRVTVNGRPATKGLKLREGQVVRLAADGQVVRLAADGQAGLDAGLDAGMDAGLEQAAFAPLKVVAQNADYAAIAKPAGLHSARLEGRDTPSVETCLSELFPGQDARLLNRLDNPTSGLLMVGFGTDAQERFRRLEAAGEVEKTYQAVVCGCVDEPMELRRALNMANRRRTKALAEEDPDDTRWTTVTPMHYYPKQNLTRVCVLIRRGARHQIRAHVADAGFPILGDDLYCAAPQPRAAAGLECGAVPNVGARPDVGSRPDVEAGPDGGARRTCGDGCPAEKTVVAAAPEREAPEADRLYLHHSRIVFADFSAELEPEWEQAFR